MSITVKTERNIESILNEVESLGSTIPKYARNIHHHFGRIGNEHAKESPNFRAIAEIDRKLASKIEEVWSELEDDEKGLFKRIVTNKCCAVLNEHRGYDVLVKGHEELIKEHFEILK